VALHGMSCDGDPLNSRFKPLGGKAKSNKALNGSGVCLRNCDYYSRGTRLLKITLKKRLHTNNEERKAREICAEGS